jgi:hypothetical protein
MALCVQRAVADEQSFWYSIFRGLNHLPILSLFGKCQVEVQELHQRKKELCN